MMTSFPAIISATWRYAANCSSSVGYVFFSRYRNSLRNRPIPAALLFNASATSETSPMFA